AWGILSVTAISRQLTTSQAFPNETQMYCCVAKRLLTCRLSGQQCPTQPIPTYSILGKKSHVTWTVACVPFSDGKETPSCQFIRLAAGTAQYSPGSTRLTLGLRVLQSKRMARL